MRFGPVAPAEAVGAILAHSIAVPGGRLRKGRTLDVEDCKALSTAGIIEVWVARAEGHDVPEDEAAEALARELVPDPDAAGMRVGHPATGRVNLHATRPGVLCFDVDRIHALNLADPGITFAVLPPVTRVADEQLIGTIKIIPYAVSAGGLRTARRAAFASRLLVRPAEIGSVSLIETRVDGLDHGAKGALAVQARVEALGAEMGPLRKVSHKVSDLADAIARTEAEAILILTGSATSDLHDVAPEAVRRAGGTVLRFGMPVDPGNLLFVGDHRGRPVVGLPGCARSPALNGADWVLDRILTGLPCGDAEIAAMGVGGLLKESPARGRPREG